METTITEIDYYLWDIAREIADEAFTHYCHNPYDRLYLYHKPTNDVAAGQVCCAMDLPDKDYVLSETSYLPRNKTKEQLKNWIYNKIRILPILPILPV